MDMRERLLGGAAAIALGAGLLAVPAEAQTSLGTVTTQSAYKADAATFYVSVTQANCTTLGATATPLTLTITPPAGQYVYLTGLYIQVMPNATASTSVVAWSSTNLTGSPAWLISTTTAAAANPSYPINLAEVYPTGIRSTVAGTAVTLVPTTSVASAYVCAHAVGYYNPT